MSRISDALALLGYEQSHKHDLLLAIRHFANATGDTKLVHQVGQEIEHLISSTLPPGTGARTIGQLRESPYPIEHLASGESTGRVAPRFVARDASEAVLNQLVAAIEGDRSVSQIMPLGRQ